MATRTGLGRTSTTGRHVIDLTRVLSHDVRMADYEAAFALSSPLHHEPLPTLVTRRGVHRLRVLVQRRARS